MRFTIQWLNVISGYPKPAQSDSPVEAGAIIVFPLLNFRQKKEHLAGHLKIA